MNIIYILIFFFLVVSIFFYHKCQEYENYLLEPYITIYARDGLNNKLRVMLAYLFKANNENKKLRVIWIKDEQCPENFDKLFEPLKNVEFFYTNEKIPNNQIDFNIGWSSEEGFIINKYFKHLKPLKNIQDDINKTIDLLKTSDNLDYISCHIRRTDIFTLAKYFDTSFSINQDDEYIKFIDEQPNNLKIYIATDNEDTQQKFIDIYGSRMIYKKIIKSDQLRQTSIQDVVKDMYVCAGSKYFMGSPWSSVTDTINELRKL